MSAPPSLGVDDLVLCAGTLAATPLEERIPAAAAAGFRGMSLFLDDLEGARARGHAGADIRARLADYGLSIAELDPLMTWTPGAQPGESGFLRWQEPDFYAAAAVVGARSINAVAFGAGTVERDAAVEAFGALCDRAAAHDLLVHLEFMPFTPVPDLATAIDIVEGAGCANGGVMYDVWHHLRSGGTIEALRRAAPRVLGVQLDDAPAAAESNLVEETLHRRLLPGAGDAQVARAIRALDAGGCQAPLGVEVFSDELATLSPLEIAQRVADATRHVISEARGDRA
jgi:sugar phosphate isomerase/epimerase